MGFDTDLVERIRERLSGIDGVVELKMFGGWGVTIHGNMAVGVMDRDLIVRVGPQNYAEALRRRGTRPFDFTGRSMTGWVYVAGDVLEHGRSLNAWVTRGVTFAQSLAPKTAKPRARPNVRRSSGP